MAGGQSASLAQGTAAPAVSLTLTGQTLTLAQESLQSGLMGQTVTASQGTATPVVSVTLTGQSLEAQQGVLTLDANFDTYLTASQGTATPVVTVELTGHGLTASQGDLALGATITNIDLTGQELTAGQGSLSHAVDSAITGLDLTTGTGTLTGVASGGVTDIELSGQVITASTGTLTAQGGNQDGILATEGGGSWNLLGKGRRKKKPLLIKFSDFETRDAYEAALAAALRPVMQAVPIEREVDSREQIKPEAESIDSDDDDKLIMALVMRMFH